MELRDSIFIFGASGLVGGYLYKLLKKNKKKVTGTFHNNKLEGLIYFDLTSSSFEDLPFKNIEYAVISSAVTKIDKCKENQKYSYRVNVIGIKKILKKIAEKEAIPIFLSSASVFDGINGGYKEEDVRNPITLYGEQKLEIEDYIALNFKGYLVIRPGKIFGVKKGEGVLFSEWYEKYKKKEEILCADDEKLSPIYIEDVAKGIALLMQKNSLGIYHINPMENFSRYELAKKFFDYLRIDDVKLKRCSIEDFNFLEKRMKNSYLDSLKFIKETNFKFTPLEECYNKIVEYAES